MIQNFLLLQIYNIFFLFYILALKKLKLWNYKADELDKPKVCQGNIVDIFIRKTWLNLNKMAFSDLVNFYSDYVSIVQKIYYD